MTADFYLTLPSNASMHLHPDNTLTHYVTSLPQRISLSGEWECGLVEIQYPHDWYNVREKDSWFFLSESSSDGHSVGGIATGYYDGTRKLIRAINRSLACIAVRQRVKLSYSDITQKVSVRMSPSTEFTTHGSMGVILGLDARTIRSPESHVPLDGDGEVYTFVKEGDSVVDMKQGFESLYVYTNVVESRVVGDSLVPLLRIVPIQGEHGHTISRHFEHVQYLPLLRKEFGTIEIDIRDDTGHAVPFERGKVTVTLHFRRRKTGLF